MLCVVGITRSFKEFDMTRKSKMMIQKKSYGFFGSIFMHADKADILLMTLGLLGSIGDGVSMPIAFIVINKLMNNIGGNDNSNTHNFTHHINEVYLKKLFVWKIFISILSVDYTP